MLFRCPYCGEKAFPTFVKLGIHSKYSQFSTSCPICKKQIDRANCIGGKLGYGLFLCVGGILFMSLLLLGITLKNTVLIVAVGILSVALYLLYNYYFACFDIPRAVKKELSTITVKLPKERIWPHIRCGEIYILAPDEISNPQQEQMQTICLLDRMERGEGGARVLLFRVIRASEEVEIETEAAMKIISDTGYFTQGRTV